jgi:hypothetical protein
MPIRFTSMGKTPADWLALTTKYWLPLFAPISSTGVRAPFEYWT